MSVIRYINLKYMYLSCRPDRPWLRSRDVESKALWELLWRRQSTLLGAISNAWCLLPVSSLYLLEYLTFAVVSPSDVEKHLIS